MLWGSTDLLAREYDGRRHRRGLDGGGIVRSPGLLRLILIAAIAAAASAPAFAQAPRVSSDEAEQSPPPPAPSAPQAGVTPPATRQESIEQQQAAKNRALGVYKPTTG